MNQHAHILIVDDEFGLAELVGELLRESGYGSTIAANGRLALESMGVTCPDLVLLDVMMPVMDGIETLRRMRADPALAAVPTVMMTAVPRLLSPSDPAAYQAALEKPFTPEQLMSTIRRLLGRADPARD